MELGISIDFIFQDIFVVIFIIVQGKRQEMILDQRENISFKVHTIC